MQFYQLAYRYLKLCKIKIHHGFLQQRMQSHPEYPALTALTDTLDELNLDYKALLVEKENVQQLAFPVIAHTYKDGGNFEIVTSMLQMQNPFFQKNWDGIVLTVEHGSKINNRHHGLLIKEKKYSTNVTITIASAVMLLLMLLFLQHFTLLIFTLSLFSLAGIFVCSFIIMHSLGKDNAITKQLCKTDGTDSCDKILNSNMAGMFKIAGLADIGLMYFTALLFYLALFTLINISETSQIILAFPLALSFVFSLCSLWYQWRIARAWCRMCLLVVAIIWLQAGILGLHLIKQGFIVSSITAENFYIVFLSIVIALAWMLIKPFILKAEDLKREMIKTLKWQRNPDVFLSSLYNQKKVNVNTWRNDIIIGAPHAAVQIMVACNPYCGPCAKTHEQIHELIETHFTNVGVTVRFTVNADNILDKRSIAVAHILYACQNNKAKTKKILHDWFSLMNLEQWLLSYNENVCVGDFKNQLKQHQSWCDENKIQYTPTIFINGYQMPANYEVKDLTLLIPTITDIIIPLTTSARAV